MQATNPPAQFRISTLFSWTAVIATLFAFVAGVGDLQESIPRALFFFFLLAPPLTCVPVMVDHLLMKTVRPGGQALTFDPFWRVWMLLCIGAYSMLMLMLATVAFVPEWQGEKGPHWLYYILDGLPGVTLWPVYLVGAGLMVDALFDVYRPRIYVLYLVAIAANALISWAYVIAVVAFKFADSQTFLAFIPGSVAVCYTLLAMLIWKNREYGLIGIRDQAATIVCWLGAVAVAWLVKIPLAMAMYRELPETAPEDCFVVTAATRGHRGFVGSWFDSGQKRLLNQQLLTFWAFEKWLNKFSPRGHRWLRAVYNRVGPVVARMIVFRWQADVIYILLKPLEIATRAVVDEVTNPSDQS